MKKSRSSLSTVPSPFKSPSPCEAFVIPKEWKREWKRSGKGGVEKVSGTVFGLGHLSDVFSNTKYSPPAAAFDFGTFPIRSGKGVRNRFWPWTSQRCFLQHQILAASCRV